MGDVINLNQFRKQRERGEKSKKARENRTKFGRSGAEKAAQRQESKKDARELEGKNLTPDLGDAADATPGTAHEPPEDGTPSAG